jgi:hypothetical protein
MLRFEKAVKETAFFLSSYQPDTTLRSWLKSGTSKREIPLRADILSVGVDVC